MFKFSYDNGRVTKSLVRWVREATLINIPLYRLGVGLLTFFWEGLGWSKMLTGSPFIDKNHLRFSLLLMFVNEVCAFAFLGIFSLSFNAEIVFLVPIHLERQRRSFDFDSYKTYKQKMSKYLMVRFVCLWAMIPWITLVVMAGYPSIPHGMLKVVSWSLFTCLIHIVGVLYPWASIQPSLSIPTHHRNSIFRKSTKFLSKERLAPIARGRTLPLNRSEWNVWVWIGFEDPGGLVPLGFRLIIPRRTRWKTNSIFLALFSSFFCFSIPIYVGVGESMSGWMNSCEYGLVAGCLHSKVGPQVHLG